MHKKRIISFLLAFVMVVSLAELSNKDTLIKANASTDTTTTTGSVLDTPFQTTTDGTAKVSIDGTKFKVGGKELWFNAANTPWNNWDDFGSTVHKFDADFWDKHFAELHKNGINATRVWISCCGISGMKISADGSFQGATDLFWQDMDTLVKIAEKYQIYLMATVQSFDHYKSGFAKRWRNLIQNDTYTDQYINNFIVPLVKRYDSSDYFWSVDLCNEPDWIAENDECGKLSWDSLCKYYAKASAAIHKNSDVQVTVGIAIIKYNSDNCACKVKNEISDANLQAITKDKDSYVDFYSTHWYAWMQSMFGFPFDQTPVAFGLDGTKPCVIGECAAKPDTKNNDSVTLIKKYQMAYINGWNGVFAWKSSGSDDGCGLINDIIPATNAMLNMAKGKIFPLTNTTISLDGFNSELSSDIYQYTGKKIVPDITVSNSTTTLVNGTDYIVICDSMLPGRATVTILGIGNYDGTIKKTFTIELGIPEITLTAGTKKATTKWEKIPGAAAYEVRMATSKTGTYSVVNKSCKKINFTKTGLVKGKTYYFKVRSYIVNEDNDKKIFGAYSNVKSVKVK